MAAERGLHSRRIKTLQDVADGSVGGGASPFQAECRIQSAPMHVDEGDDAAIRVAARHDGQDGEQQHMRQLVELAFRPTRVGYLGQQIQQRRERSHGNLQTVAAPGVRHPAIRESPFCQTLRFGSQVLPIGLSSACPAALNSHVAKGEHGTSSTARTLSV